MTDRFDAIILGMGPGGEVAASRLLQAGNKVAVIERELIGGGSYRDYMIRHLDDSKQVMGYEEQGATVITDAGRLVGPGTVEAGGQRLEADHVVVATGSSAMIPPIEGLEEVGAWTNREATTLQEIPRSATSSGRPVGIELGQMLARFGSKVTLIEMLERLMPEEDPEVGELIQAVLQEEGIEVRTGRQGVRARKEGVQKVLELDDGSSASGDVLVVGAGGSRGCTTSGSRA